MVKKKEKIEVQEETGEQEYDESSGDVKKSKMRQSIYRDYERAIAKCKTKSIWLGGRGTFKDEPYTHEFVRDSKGKIIIPADYIRAMFRNSMHYVNMTGTIAMKWMFPVQSILETNGHKTFMEPKPIISPTGGRGINKFEALPPGCEFTIDMDIPTSRITREQFIRVLKKAGERVGTYAYRKGQYGLFDVLDVKFVKS